MKKLLNLCVILCTLGLLAGDAKAQQTVTLTWTWPTLRADGVTALPLSQIGSIAIFDAPTPAPGTLGTAITCNAGTFPPTTATGTCTTGTLAAGSHNFTAVVSDTASPPDAGTPSVAVSVTVPLLGPGPVSNFVAKVN